MIKFLKYVELVIKNSFYKILEVMKKNFLIILSFLELYAVFCFISAKYGFDYKNIFMFLLVFVIVEILKSSIRLYRNEENKLPIVKTRYTKKDDEGNIIIKNKDFPQAMNYFYTLEEYIERNYTK